jgi:hypothetical protein
MDYFVMALIISCLTQTIESVSVMIRVGSNPVRS